ncbi:hypothetical protein QL285_051682 [Trifolium repens]|nr:hypothetical protein QL285_051682 [Trifolium repens]
MHSAAFMGVSATVHFPSLLFSVTNRNPLFSLHHHRITLWVYRITSSPPQPLVFKKEWAKSISGAFNFTIASLDQPLVFNFHPSI